MSQSISFYKQEAQLLLRTMQCATSTLTLTQTVTLTQTLLQMTLTLLNVT